MVHLEKPDRTPLSQAGSLDRRTTVAHGGIVVALTMAGLIVAVGLLLPRSQHLGSLMVVVPAAAAALAGPRSTAAVTAVACSGAALLDTVDAVPHTTIFAVHLLAILLVAAIIVTFRTVREENLRELIEVRTVSETIQRVLLRPLPPRIGCLNLRCSYHACDPYTLIGGDLYASAKTTDAVRLIIGDVKGKGLAAVEDSAALLGALRGVLQAESPLPEVMAELEHSVRSHFQQAALCDSDAVERFITVLMLEIPDAGGHTQMINCGHPPPYLISPAGARLLDSVRPAPPLGLGSLRPQDYPVETVLLPPEATLLLYTDGAIEARNRNGQYYDLTAQLSAWRPGTELEELLQQVLDGLTAHLGGSPLEDDVALVALNAESTSGFQLRHRTEPPVR